MEILMIAAALAIIIVLIYLVRTYNLLINLKLNAERQASHIDVHLKKRYDLIPALVEVVKGYAKHEKETIEEVTKLRTDWTRKQTIDEKVRVANRLDAAISRLLLIQENYPTLKANTSFLNIQRNLSHIENELVHERKVYNKRVSWYNLRLQQVPACFVAKIFGFKEKTFFTMRD